MLGGCASPLALSILPHLPCPPFAPPLSLFFFFFFFFFLFFFVSPPAFGCSQA